ncbi:MAG: gamma carbonic anhydrase family protein [Halorhodospira sp.]
MIREYGGIRPRIDSGAWVDATALVIGHVTLHEEVSVWPMAVLRGDVHRIVVGARTNIQDGAVVHVAHDGPYSPGGHPAVIGAEVTVGHQAVIHACQVGDHCLVGIGATLLDGAVVGAESIIGAGALVPPGKQLEGGYLYLGNPAQPVRELTDSEREQLRYSANHYVDLKDRHRGIA